MIFFIHIPKTAGTTFYDVVKLNYTCFLKPKKKKDLNNFFIENNGNKSNCALRLPGGYSAASEGVQEFINLSTKEQKKIDFVGGHVGYGIHEFVDFPVNYISFLRNPIERLISDFKEHNKKGRYFYEKLKKNEFNCNTYLNLLLDEKMDNFMTRQLSGSYNFLISERKKIELNDLELALKNCENIVFFEMKDFDKAMLYFYQKYNWNKVKYTIKNKSQKLNVDLNFDNDLLNEVLKYDLKLYERIKTENVPFNSFFERVMFNFKKQ